jgi:predicted DNA-binding transcriptional regulator AlpA
MTGKEVANFKRIKELGIPYSRPHIWRLMQKGEFPRAFKLGPHRNSPPVWWQPEIFEWLEAKAKQPTAP